MENAKIVDAKAKTWFVNMGQFPFVDPETNVTFVPNTPTLVNESAWMKSQPVIQLMTDPTQDLEELRAKVESDAKAADAVYEAQKIMQDKAHAAELARVKAAHEATLLAGAKKEETKKV